MLETFTKGIAFGEPDHDEFDKPWEPLVEQIGQIMDLSEGDGILANKLLREAFRPYPVHAIAYSVGILSMPEAAYAFRGRYALFQERLGNLNPDPRNADLVLSAVCINLHNWFIKHPDFSFTVNNAVNTN